MHLRFFLSSPGDVADERTFAQQVIEQELPKDPLLRGQITCEAIRWDDPNAPVSMPATLTPQEAVNRGLAKPSQCDVVIVILWSRLGTPLPDTYKKPDGSPYLSGTEWEYEDAITAKPPPHILVYHRKTKPDFGDPTEPAFDEKVQQFRRVQEFFKGFRNADGSLKGGFAEYNTPQEFRDRLRLDLRAFIQRRLPKKPEEYGHRKVPPPPYGVIAKALNAGRIVPIIGAGASHSGRPADARWNPQAPEFLPSGVELSHFLADDTGFPSEEERGQLAEVASYYEAFQTRATLRERLRQVLGPDALANVAIPPLYRFLAEVPRPLLIITANYDTQIERAFRAVQKPYDLVVYGADRKDFASSVLWWPAGAVEPETPMPNELQIDLETTTVIFKMHGSILPEKEEWDSFVITETDYVEFLSRIIANQPAIPRSFGEYCRDRSLLFLGYSLRDWNFRTILQSLYRFFARRRANYGEEIPSWAIDEHFSELEIKFWQEWDIHPHEVNIDEFVEKLRAKMST